MRGSTNDRRAISAVGHAHEPRTLSAFVRDRRHGTRNMLRTWREVIVKWTEDGSDYCGCESDDGTILLARVWRYGRGYRGSGYRFEILDPVDGHVTEWGTTATMTDARRCVGAASRPACAPPMTGCCLHAPGSATCRDCDPSRPIAGGLHRRPTEARRAYFEGALAVARMAKPPDVGLIALLEFGLAG